MNRNQRFYAMIVCLVIIIIVGIAGIIINNSLEILSFTFGLAVGWAFRETLIPKEEKAE